MHLVNPDEHKSTGTHWVALYVYGNKTTYFDSFGVEHILEKIKTFLKRMVKQFLIIIFFLKYIISMSDIPAGIYLLKVNNRNTRTRCEICSKLTIKTPDQHDWRRSGVLIVKFEHISHLAEVFTLTLNM